MKEFFTLNRSKLKFAFKFTSIVFVSLVLIIFAIGYLNGQVPELSLFVIVILGAGIGMPLFILVIGTIRGTWDLYKRRKAFNNNPFSELLNHGFTEQLKNAKNRWQFSEPLLCGNLENFRILAEVDTQNAPDVIRFQALTEIETIGKDEAKRLTRKFSPYNIELDFNGATKTISVKDSRITSIDQLMNELKQFIEIIRSENFKPKATEHNTEAISYGGF